MDISLDFASPLKEGTVKKFVEELGLTTEPPLECFGGQIFSSPGTGGRIRVAVTKNRNRIVISTSYLNAHMRSYQLLRIAQAAVPLGDCPVLEFSHEFTHMTLEDWFPNGIRTQNQIRFPGGN